MATLRKGDLVGLIAKQSKSSKAQAQASLDAVLTGIRNAIREGNRLVLTGFGTFEVRQVKARRVRAIRGGTVTVRAHKRVGFTPGTGLSKAARGRR